MPEIPHLQTGMDVSNTLFRLAALKQQQQQQDIENARAASQDTRQNALYELQNKQAQLELIKAQNDARSDDAAMIANTDDKDAITAYNQVSDFWNKMGQPFPDASAFGNDPVKIKNYARSTAENYMKLKTKGQKITQIVANPNYKKDMPISDTNYPSQIIEGYSNGMGGIVQTTEPKPYISEITKFGETQRKNRASENIARERNAIDWARISESQKDRASREKIAKDKALNPVDWKTARNQSEKYITNKWDSFSKAKQTKADVPYVPDRMKPENTYLFNEDVASNTLKRMGYIPENLTSQYPGMNYQEIVDHLRNDGASEVPTNKTSEPVKKSTPKQPKVEYKMVNGNNTMYINGLRVVGTGTDSETQKKVYKTEDGKIWQ